MKGSLASLSPQGKPKGKAASLWLSCVQVCQAQDSRRFPGGSA